MQRYKDAIMDKGAFISSVSALLIFLASPFFASADEGGIGISVSPMFQEVTLEENRPSQDISFEASNTTDSLVTLRLSVLDFGSLDESGGVAFLGSDQNFEKRYGIASWIRLDRDALVLGPGESQAVKATFENRESLSPGGHYGAVVFKVENSGADAVDEHGKLNIAVAQSFSSLIFAKKIGGESYGLEMRNIDARKNIAYLPETVSLRFQNTGNVHVVPRGVVTLTDPKGRVVRKGIINQESAIILPETLRSFIVHPISLSVAYLPGRYMMTVQYRYDGKDDMVVRTYDFLYIPPFEIALVVLSVGALVWRRKRMKI